MNRSVSSGRAEAVKRAAEALHEVAERARVFYSMPVIPGITPAALMDEARSESKPGEPLPRRHGVFRLNEIGISCLDHGVLYGDGCFEGILIAGDRVFLLKEHIHRLWYSARKLSIEIPYAPDELIEHMLSAARQVKLEAGLRGYIRLLVTRGLGDLGINPAKCVGATVFSLASTIRLYPREMYETGIELGVTRHIRRPDGAVLDPTVKSNNYINNVLALIEGTGRGSTLESLILTNRGFIAEATVDNLFLIERYPGWQSDPGRVKVLTPRREYCLNGITRALVLDFCRGAGYDVDEEADILPIDLIGEDRECFMTGTGAGVMPIVGIAGNPVGDGLPGPVTRTLVAKIDDAQRDPAYGLPLTAKSDAIRAYMDAPSVLPDEMRLYAEGGSELHTEYA